MRLSRLVFIIDGGRRVERQGKKIENNRALGPHIENKGGGRGGVGCRKK